MEKQSSRSSFYGKFTNNKMDKELIFSYKSSTLTIVERSIISLPQSIAVFRACVDQISQSFTMGECVEKGSFSSNYVYKAVKINSGRRDNGFRYKEENNITIEEFKLQNPHKSLTHTEKQIGYTMYDFVLIKKKEKVEVSRFIFSANGVKTLVSHSLFSKEDNFNRNWQDVPVNNEILSDVKKEMWVLKYLISKCCCWEDCEIKTNIKCSRCHHYVCASHSEEIVNFEEDLGADEAEVQNGFIGELIVTSLCWHCADKHCNFECLRWF